MYKLVKGGGFLWATMKPVRSLVLGLFILECTIKLTFTVRPLYLWSTLPFEFYCPYYHAWSWIRTSWCEHCIFIWWSWQECLYATNHKVFLLKERNVIFATWRSHCINLCNSLGNGIRNLIPLGWVLQLWKVSVLVVLNYINLLMGHLYTYCFMLFHLMIILRKPY